MNSRGRPVLLSAIAAMGLGVLFVGGSRDFCLDDAYIHLDYALSLSSGQGFSYNPGDWETGSSSPLWALVLAVWPWCGHPIVAVKLLGVLLHAATAGVVAEVARSVSCDSPSNGSDDAYRRTTGCWAGLVAGLLTAAAPSLLQAATSGMEVSLTTMLLALSVLCELRRRPVAGFITAALATWTRPEALFFLGSYGTFRWLSARRAVSLLLPLGSLFALGLWMLYCLGMSHALWPNAKYVKDVGFAPAGLPYLLVEVLPIQPWLVGMGGLVLLWRALRVRRDSAAALAMMGAWLLTVIAISVSRPCQLGILFYASRYFAIAAAIPHVVVALGLTRVPRALGALCLVPIAIVNFFQIRTTLEIQRAQEQDIRLLHTAPARFMATALPRDAVVLVEGAGATRFYTPRSMRIVDALGLNDRTIAHAVDGREKICRMLARAPTHILIPESLRVIAVPLQVSLMRRFTDAHYRMAHKIASVTVLLFSTSGLKPEWQHLCPPVAYTGRPAL